MLQLPAEILLLAFRYLENPEDLRSLITVSQNWKTVAIANTLWRPICARIGIGPADAEVEAMRINRARNTDSEKLHNLTQRERYIQFRRKYGAYHKIVGIAQLSFLPMKAWMRRYAPITYHTLMPGIEWSVVRESNITVGFANGNVRVDHSQGTRELMGLYHLANGQSSPESGYFGTYHQWSTWWYPIHRCKVERMPTMTLLVFAERIPSYSIVGLVLTSSSPSTNHLLDHVIECDTNTQRYTVHASSPAAFFANWGQRALAGELDIVDRGKLCCFPNRGTPQQSFNNLDGMRVVVSTLPAVHADPYVDLYVYRVTIAVANPADVLAAVLGRMAHISESIPSGVQVRLVMQRWRIGYADDFVETVEGNAFDDHPTLVALPKSAPNAPPAKSDPLPRRSFDYVALVNGFRTNTPKWMEGEFGFSCFMRNSNQPVRPSGATYANCTAKLSEEAIATAQRDGMLIVPVQRFWFDNLGYDDANVAEVEGQVGT